MKPFEKKKIALDFDDTFTLNPTLWHHIVDLMVIEGDFDVRFVTFRYPTDDNSDIEFWANELDIKVIYCSGVQKAQVCAENRWTPDVWIDDMPILIPMKLQLQGMILGIEKNEGKHG